MLFVACICCSSEADQNSILKMLQGFHIAAMQSVLPSIHETQPRSLSSVAHCYPESVNKSLCCIGPIAVSLCVSGAVAHLILWSH